MIQVIIWRISKKLLIFTRLESYLLQTRPRRPLGRRQDVSEDFVSTRIVVLVVEDEPIILLDVADQLRDAGFDVIEASNADQAIKHLNNNPAIRLLFTDIDMPGSMDGLKLAAAVRDRWPPVKIIVTSGRHTMLDDELPEGCLFASKPYTHDAIFASMKTLLGTSHTL